jgi:hypothetical protein
MNGRRFIILVSVALVLLAGGSGVTGSFYMDLESSVANAFQAWASGSWVQTDQADFDAGVLNQVQTSGSGDVMLAAQSGWYDTSWSRRCPVNITNAGAALSDYQVMVSLSYDPAMRADFGDVRFTDGGGENLLSYWVQSYVTSASAVFWVKVPSVPSGAATIFVYYGNPAAGSASDGWNTFDFFDDFSAGLGQWTIDAENTDAVSVSNDAGSPSPSLRQDPDSSQTKNSYYDTRLITNNYKILNGVIEYDVYLAGSARIIHQLGWRVPSLNFENGYCWRVQTATSDGGHLRFTGRASWSCFGTAFAPVSANTWHSVKEVVNGSNYTGYVDGGPAYSGTDSTKLTADYLVSHVHGVSLTASSYVLVDNIRVRKYSSTEPVASAGSPQSMYAASGSIASQVLDTGTATDRWDALFWDETLEPGTGVSFQVRASDSPFARDTSDAALPWITVGSVSPVTSGLPPGQYMQWRALLTTSDLSRTPVLHEVTVYHY